MGALIDETGNRYGRATVLRRGPSGKNGDAQWWCECECGNTFLTRGYSLRTGHTKSCGCLATDSKRILMVDSSLGYVLGNVVPCCSTCNFAKRDMAYQEFLAWLDRLVAYRGKHGH